MPPLVTTSCCPNHVLAVCTSNDSTNRGAPVPTYVDQCSTEPLPCNCSRSKRAICALVSAIDAFCGRLQSIPSSSRSDGGKNCCCTNVMPNNATEKAATVTPTVIQRGRIQTSRRGGQLRSA